MYFTVFMLVLQPIKELAFLNSVQSSRNLILVEVAQSFIKGRHRLGF